MSKKGGGAKRLVLLGTDYVYPRTTNKILRYFLHSKGVADDDIMEKYTPFGHSDYQTIVAKIKKFAAGKRTAVVSTINGDSNVPFYKELGNQGLKATDIPVVAFSVGEEELRGIDTKPLVGHLAAWNYFSRSTTRQQGVHRQVEGLREEEQPAGRRQARHQRPDGGHVHRHPHVGAGGRAGEARTNVDAVRQAVGGQTSRRRRASTSRWTRRTTTCTSRSSSARSRPTASSRSSGRPRARSAPRPGARSSPTARRRSPTGPIPWACGNCTDAEVRRGAESLAAAQVESTRDTDAARCRMRASDRERLASASHGGRSRRSSRQPRWRPPVRSRTPLAAIVRRRRSSDDDRGEHPASSAALDDPRALPALDAL